MNLHFFQGDTITQTAKSVYCVRTKLGDNACCLDLTVCFVAYRFCSVEYRTCDVDNKSNWLKASRSGQKTEADFHVELVHGFATGQMVSRCSATGNGASKNSVGEALQRATRWPVAILQRVGGAC